MLIVRTINDGPVRRVHEMVEDPFNGREVLVIIQMLLFDIQDHRMSRLIKPKSAIAFIAFGHKKSPFRIPMSIRSQDRYLPANIVTRVEPTDPQNMGRPA